jgi:hypothetical protein
LSGSGKTARNVEMACSLRIIRIGRAAGNAGTPSLKQRNKTKKNQKHNQLSLQKFFFHSERFRVSGRYIKQKQNLLILLRISRFVHGPVV